MTESKAVLSALTKAWNKRPRKISYCLSKGSTIQGYSPKEIDAFYEEFGVLLSQSSEELQKQAKTLHQAWKDAITTANTHDKLFNELWVRLDAVADTEKRKETK